MFNTDSCVIVSWSMEMTFNFTVAQYRLPIANEIKKKKKKKRICIMPGDR